MQEILVFEGIVEPEKDNAPSLLELREKEDQIKKAMMDGLDSHLAKTKTFDSRSGTVY